MCTAVVGGSIHRLVRRISAASDQTSTHRWQAIVQTIGESFCEAGSSSVCLAFQSHFRIIAWAGLPLMADFSRESGVLRSAQSTRAKTLLVLLDHFEPSH